MMNMIKVGRKISALRKENNMTQMALAEKLNISYQAVSNWERGNSMPDIVKLPELASLFHVTIDDLLGEPSPIIIHAADGTMEDYCREHEVTAAELIEAAPILKPSQIDTALEYFPDLHIEELSALLPFLDQETLDQFAQEAKNPQELHKLAPFVSSSIMDELALKFAEQNKEITTLLPFVSSSLLDSLAEKLLSQERFSDLSELFPFLSKTALEKIAQTALETGKKDFLQSVAPFLEDDFLEELAKHIIETGDTNLLVLLAPFLDSSVLSNIIKKNFSK